MAPGTRLGQRAGMRFRHLRSNAVAYLARVVALTTGTAYAAQVADGSVTAKKLAKNSVTSPKIKKGAVKSADIKDRSVSAVDLALGVVPGASWVGGRTGPSDSATTPGATPDVPEVQVYDFVLPRPGRLQLRLSNSVFTGGCPDGSSARIGLYLDDSPIPATSVVVGSEERGVDLVGIVQAAAGPHRASLGYDCPDTSLGYSGYGYESLAWSAVLGQ